MRVSLVLLALTTLPAWGTTTYYVGDTGPGSEETFDIDAGSLNFFNFSAFTGFPALSFLELNTGIAFSAAINNGATAANVTLSGTRLSQVSGFGGTDSTIVLDIPETVRIIGMHLSTTTATDFCVGAPGTTACAITLSLTTTPKFFGIISDEAIPDFQIRRLNSSGTSRLLQITHIAASSGSSATPEPSTFALVGSGLILFPLIARRRRASRRA